VATLLGNWGYRGNSMGVVLMLPFKNELDMTTWY